MTEYRAHIGPLPSAIQSEMRGRSWHEHEGCPAFSTLRLLSLTHHDFVGGVQEGELVVAERVAEETVAIFARLFEAEFPLHSLRRIDAFDGSDDASMAANNSSAFNFRCIAGTSSLSHHALGLAIDLNPVQNPWVRPERIDPPAGAAFLDRGALRPGMIVASGPVVAAFADFGWSWGGTFRNPDYHHFSKLPAP